MVVESVEFLNSNNLLETWGLDFAHIENFENRCIDLFQASQLKLKYMDYNMVKKKNSSHLVKTWPQTILSGKSHKPKSQ